MMGKQIMCNATLLVAILGVLDVDAADSVQLELQPANETAIAGIPVVVRLQYSNHSEVNVEVYPLVDFYLGFVRWRWDAKEAAPYDVGMTDFHSAMPGISLPQKVTLMPREKQFWYFTVPTPVAFGAGVKWTLTATVRDLAEPTKSKQAATTLIGRDPQIRLVSEALGNTGAQGALLDVHGEGQVRLLAKRGKMGLVEECSRKADRAADLILFVRAVVEKKGVALQWKKLEDAPIEIRCLRNYLLFRPLEHAGGVITEGEAEAIRTTMSPKSPLGAELLDRIDRRRR